MLHGLSPVAASGDYSQVAVYQLFIAGDSPVAGMGSRERGLGSVGSGAAVSGLSRPMACGISLDHRLNSCPLHWQLGS